MMKKTTRSALVAMSLGMAALAAQATELVTNTGFESGTTGWTFDAGTGAAAVTSDHANSGSYAAALTGNDSSITQTFAATLVSSISQFSLYAMSDTGAFDAVVFSYSDGTTSDSTLFGLGDTGWTLYDLTSDLVSGKSLVGFSIYGAYGQTNYLDDVTLSTVSAVPEPGSFALMLAGLLAVVPLVQRRRMRR